MFSDYVDDTMPLPADVEREFFDKAADQTSALEWLALMEIDSVPVLGNAGRVAIIQWTLIWDADAERYGFHIYSDDHVGPKADGQLAIPVMQNGKFIDLLLIDADDLTFTRACSNATWLGGDEFGREGTIRLHRAPIDWLEAGCRGVCHVESISRQGLKDLRQASHIVCNDTFTALEAWDWAFGADDDELARFAIDDSPENIRAYFAQQAQWQAMSIIHARAAA